MSLHLMTRQAPRTKAASLAAITTALLWIKDRFVTKSRHSLLVAMVAFGPVTTIRAIRMLIMDVFAGLGPALRGCKKESDYLAEYQARRSDIVVDVPGKSGTTWLMQICHQLRMRGKEHDYDDQMDVMPWLEGSVAAVLDQDINMEQCAEPRVFKSHLTWKRVEQHLPDYSKVIYCFRDVKDQLYSMWRFIPPIAHAEISAWAFSIAWCAKGSVDEQLHNLCDFWEHRHCARVCFFFFDDLKERHVECVQRVQTFMGIEPDEALTQKVVEQSTHAYMSRPDQAKKFDDHAIVFACDRKRGLTRTMPLTGKVRKDGGQSGTGKEALPQAVLDWIDWRWECIVFPRTGFKSMKDMRSAWLSELEQSAQVSVFEK